MLFRKYGNTGKIVSLLGFGGMRFKQEDLSDEAGLLRCAEVVRFASLQEINYFDIAPTYANGKGELIYGIAFQKMPNPFFVSTKTSFHLIKLQKM